MNALRVDPPQPPPPLVPPTGGKERKGGEDFEFIFRRLG